MKCPHCNYVHGWDAESGSSIEGKEGDFYEDPVRLERRTYSYYSQESVKLYACPSCRKAFIGD